MREFNYTWSCGYCDAKGKTKWSPYALNAPLSIHIRENHLDEAFQDIIKRYTDKGKTQFLKEHSDLYKVRCTIIPETKH